MAGWQDEIEDLQEVLLDNFSGLTGTWLWDQFNAAGASAGMTVKLDANVRYFEPWVEHIGTRMYSAGRGPDIHQFTLWFNLMEPLGLGASSIYGVAETIREILRSASWDGFNFWEPSIHRAGPAGSHFTVTLRCPGRRIAAVASQAFVAPG